MTTMQTQPPTEAEYLKTAAMARLAERLTAVIDHLAEAERIVAEIERAA